MSIKMDYPFQVLRGWPGGVTEQNITIKSGSTLYAGDAVVINSSGTVEAAGAGPLGDEVAFVVAGNGDNQGAKASNTATVLFGNFVARTIKYNTGAGLVPGDKLTVKAGVLDKAGSTDPVVGIVRGIENAQYAPDGSSVAPLVFVAK